MYPKAIDKMLFKKIILLYYLVSLLLKYSKLLNTLNIKKLILP